MRPWPRVVLSLLLVGVFGVLIVFNLLGDRIRWSGRSYSSDSGSSQRPSEGTSGFQGATRPDPPRPGQEQELDAPGARFTGQVLAGGMAAAGAELEWLPEGIQGLLADPLSRTRAAGDGRFLLVAPPGQAGTLRATLEGYPALLSHGLIAPEALESMDLGRLELPPPCYLRALVLDRAEGEPVAGAALTLARPQGLAGAGGPPLETSTGPDGRARLGPVAPGPWRLEARASTFSPIAARVDLAADQAAGEATLFLPRGPGLRGRVQDRSGKALVEIEVVALPRLEGDGDERAWAATTSDGTGHFHLEGLMGGFWRLEARGAGHALPQAAVLSCPPPEPVLLVLEALPLLQGTVRTPGGPAPADTRVLLALARGEGSSWLIPAPARTAVPDASGRFRIELDRPLGAGPWELVALAQGWLPVAGPHFLLEPGEGLAPQDLVLEPGEEIRGRLVPGEGGRALIGWAGAARLAALLPAQPPLVARTGPEGEFRLAPVRPGRHLVRLEVPGRVPKDLRVLVEPGKSADLGLVLLASGWRPRGTLLGPSGAPEPGGLVWLIPEPQGEPIQAIAGEGGSFRFPPLPAGTYTLKACRRDAGDLERLADYAATARSIPLGGRSPEDLGTIRIAPSGKTGSERPR